MDNVAGTFTIELDGQSREMKMTFGVIERLERSLLKRPIVSLLHEASTNRAALSDIALVFHECLAANNDTRMNAMKVGEALHKKGFANCLDLYIEVLVYALYGSAGVNTETTSADDKKK